MLTNFNRLNEPNEVFEDQDRFVELLMVSKDLRNILYKPNILEPTDDEHPKIKIWDTTFTNVSFSKTTLNKINFYNCKFEDCLFNGTELLNCEFHNCNFKNCITHKITISKCYIDPENFASCLNSSDKANIGVHLFQQLINNSIDTGQSDHKRSAEYHFRKWKDRLAWNKYWRGKPYKTNIWEFLGEYPLYWLYRHTFGYGLRLKNFVITFFLTFSAFYLFNYINWNAYQLKEKDLVIDSFASDSVNYSSNFYYTLDVTTKLIDSQFQATSNYGMTIFSIQSIVAFVFLSALSTIIINRFVK
jgi:hypothetical protein